MNKFKVICTFPGRQDNESARVCVGSIYTVVQIVKGWECMHPDTDADFYILSERPKDIAYHNRLFSLLSENSEENEEVLLLELEN